MSDRYGSRHDADTHDRKLEDPPKHLVAVLSESEQEDRDRQSPSPDNPTVGWGKRR